MTMALEVWIADPSLGLDHARVGTLHRTSSRTGDVIRFEYADEWLFGATGKTFAISPDLPLTRGPFFAAAPRITLGMFRDMAPDRWGRVLMERREAAQVRLESRTTRRLTEWDFLCGVNDTTRLGALRLRDPGLGAFVDDQELGVPPSTRLRELEAIARRIDESTNQASRISPNTINGSGN